MSSVTIVGGGLAGASLACALEPLALDITVLESVPFESNSQPSFDERTIALTWSSRQVLDAIGIWQDTQALAGPIHRIHISNRGHTGITRLDRRLIGVDALGYVVPTRVLGQALAERLKASTHIDYRSPARAVDLDITGDAVSVRIAGEQTPVTSQLVVIADGGRSPLRELAGIREDEQLYNQAALVTIVGVDRDHDCTAFERFTRHGPLALLPLDGRRFALAWTLPPNEAEEVQALPEVDFLERLQCVFGDRVGFFVRCGNRQLYPLKRARVTDPVSVRVVALGNAAHVVHPVAGQGFNLGLRDVAEFAELLAGAVAKGTDIGDADLLRRYADARVAQTRRVLGFTDGLLRLFANELPGLTIARNLALNTLEVLPPVKHLLLARTAGLTGRLPRLSRGLPLASAP